VPRSGKPTVLDIVANDIRRPYPMRRDASFPREKPVLIEALRCIRQDVVPEEDGRAGRWSSLDKTECGLHGAAGEARS
jgi:hypothetical protein